jgi:E3 ubiquitin-protein ligase HUWE1
MLWPPPGDHNIDIATLASEDEADQKRVEALPPKYCDVSFSFYGKKQEGTNPKPTVIHLPISSIADEAPFQVLSNSAKNHEMSPEDHFELLCRIRAGQATTASQRHLRHQLVIVRLLSIAIFAHTHAEQDAYSSLFLYEPDLVAHIAELLQLERNIPSTIRIAAVAALDALARYRGKTQDVMTAVNAGVNHGILMGLFRQMINDMNDPAQDNAQALAEVALAFISYLATHTSGGNLVISAGLIPLLIQITENKLPSRMSTVSKTMTLIDNILYGYPNSFQVFVASRGVDAMVNRIKVCLLILQ